jgi:hypothetical protein
VLEEISSTFRESSGVSHHISHHCTKFQQILSSNLLESKKSAGIKSNLLHKVIDYLRMQASFCGYFVRMDKFRQFVPEMESPMIAIMRR